MWLWAKYFISLSLNFLTYKVRFIIPTFIGCSRAWYLGAFPFVLFSACPAQKSACRLIICACSWSYWTSESQSWSVSQFMIRHPLPVTSLSSLTISFLDNNTPVTPTLINKHLKIHPPSFTHDCENYIHGHLWYSGISAHIRNWKQFQGHSIQLWAPNHFLSICSLSCIVRFIMELKCYDYGCHYEIYLSKRKFSKAQPTGFLFQALFNKM